MGDLSVNFSRHEFACKCGCGLDAINLRTVLGLQQFRDLVSEKRKKDTPITPNCGCRCAKHNAELKPVPGATNSQHLPKNGCRAVDIPKIKGLTVLKMYEIALQVPIFEQGGIIMYDWGLHLDSRISGIYRDNRQTKVKRNA